MITIAEFNYMGNVNQETAFTPNEEPSTTYFKIKNNFYI